MMMLRGLSAGRYALATSASTASWTGSAWTTATSRAPGRIRQVDHREVGQAGHGQPGDRPQRRLVIERRGQRRPALGQEPEPGFVGPQGRLHLHPVGDVLDRPDDADEPAGVVPHQRAAVDDVQVPAVEVSDAVFELDSGRPERALPASGG